MVILACEFEWWHLWTTIPNLDCTVITTRDHPCHSIAILRHQVNGISRVKWTVLDTTWHSFFCVVPYGAAPLRMAQVTVGSWPKQM